MIQTRNVSLNIGGNEIFTNISFEAKPGSITHIEGKNGSGKTSLLKCITGIFQDYTGEIQVGSEIISRSNWPDVTPQISFFIDKGFSYPYLSVADNLKIFKYYSNEPKLKDELEDLIKEFDLESVLKKKVSKISAGFVQKLEIIIALLNNGKYILLDEPTVNLDQHSADILYHYIVETSSLYAKTYIVVSHNDNKLRKVSSQTISL